jgi:hypothetical protein
LATPSIGPRYGFPRLKIIISRNIYRMGTLIVIIAAFNIFEFFNIKPSPPFCLQCRNFQRSGRDLHL